mgnify:CR=1 FL=1
MVCLGNICRSPLAEGIMRQKIEERNLHADVRSSGTSSYHESEPADPRTISTARRHGLDITRHRASQFAIKDFDRYDMIFVMDQSNYHNVLRLARNDYDRRKVRMIMNMTTAGKNTDVPDPYYSGSDGFELVYSMLDEACEKIADEIEKL